MVEKRESNRNQQSPDGCTQPDEEALFLGALRRLYSETESEIVPAPIPGLIRVARLVKILAFRSLGGSFSPNIIPSYSTSEYRFMTLRLAAARLNDAVEASAREGSLVLRDELTGIPLTDWNTPPGVQSWEKWAMNYKKGRLPPFLFSICGADFSRDICVKLVEFADWAEAQGIATSSELDELLSEHSATSPAATEEAAKNLEAPEICEHTGNERQSTSTWQESARIIADQCFDRDTANNCRDSLAGYSRRVMEEMQQHKIHGPRGRIDNPATIQRDALQGKRWWADKKK